MVDLSKWYVIVLSVISVGAQNSPSAVTMGILGKSFWPPSVNLFELLTTGTRVYSDSVTLTCRHIVPISESPSTLIYYSNNNAFYRSIGASLEVSLDIVSFATISNTVDNLFQEFRETAHQSVQLDYGKFVQSYDLSKSCLVSKPLDPTFVTALLQLPQDIDDPSSIDSFADYEQFVTLYGGFVLTGVKVGARLQVFATAETSRNYTRTQFNNRVCVPVSLGTLGTVPVNIGPCIGFSYSTLSSSRNLHMSTRYYPRGGNKTLQTQLSTQGITPSVLTKFIQSASTNPYPVDYTLTPLWHLYTGNNATITKRLDNIQLYFTLLSREEEDTSKFPTYVYYILAGVLTVLLCICVTCCAYCCYKRQANHWGAV